MYKYKRPRQHVLSAFQTLSEDRRLDLKSRNKHVRLRHTQSRWLVVTTCLREYTLKLPYICDYSLETALSLFLNPLLSTIPNSYFCEKSYENLFANSYALVLFRNSNSKTIFTKALTFYLVIILTYRKLSTRISSSSSSNTNNVDPVGMYIKMYSTHV